MHYFKHKIVKEYFWEVKNKEGYHYKKKNFADIFITFEDFGVGCSVTIEETAGRVKSTAHVQLVNYF